MAGRVANPTYFALIVTRESVERAIYACRCSGRSAITTTV
jgi:hypothetical protein